MAPRTLNRSNKWKYNSRERTDVTQSRSHHNGNRVFRAAAGFRTLDQYQYVLYLSTAREENKIKFSLQCLFCLNGDSSSEQRS